MSPACGVCRCENRSVCEIVREAPASIAPAKAVHFRNAASVFGEGSPAGGIYLLCRGSIKLTAATAAGAERLVDIVWPGEIFGLECLLDRPRRLWSAVAREASAGHYIPVTSLSSALHTREELLWKTMIALNGVMHRALQDKLIASGGPLAERIPRLLESLARRHGSPCRARPVTQAEIAELLGVSPKAVCRALRASHSHCCSKPAQPATRGMAPDDGNGRAERM
jgi:CRP-like cAMP-binding protein